MDWIKWIYLVCRRTSPFVCVYVLDGVLQRSRVPVSVSVSGKESLVYCYYQYEYEYGIVVVVVVVDTGVDYVPYE